MPTTLFREVTYSMSNFGDGRAEDARVSSTAQRLAASRRSLT